MTALQVASGPLAPASALLSPDGTYRYELRRTWNPRLGIARWIMLNPSIADALIDDPTVRRCIDFTRAWGLGGLVIHNLYALRATKPAELRRHPHPVGPWNDACLFQPAPWRLTVAAWGAHREIRGRDRRVVTLLARRGVRLHHLGPLTAGGHPRHPLYTRANATLRAFAPLSA